VDVRRSNLIVGSLAAIALVAAACGGGTGSADQDMLDRIKADGVIRVATDANYAPQSFLKEDGTSEGFDIDVANEVASRLGVTAEFQYPDWSVIEGGNWADRFDISVGSMTITEPRLGIFDFSQPYYYTPAQMTVVTDSGINDLAGLAGKTICTGEATTYYQWLTGTLVLGDQSEQAPVPEGAKATTLATDQDCAQSVQSGRRDFEGWLSSSTTVKAALDAGAPMKTVGTPVFYEPLAIAIDKASPPHDALAAEIDRIIGEMHADGTLSALSNKWFDGLDLSITP
jgi:polar amino acid transport system substrate-binding protein